MAVDKHCAACGLEAPWRKGWTHDDGRDHCPHCGPFGRDNPKGHRHHWITQATEHAISISAAGGRPAALLAESLKGGKAHILLIENGWTVRFSPYLEEGAAYTVDARFAFPTDQEICEQAAEYFREAARAAIEEYLVQYIRTGMKATRS